MIHTVTDALLILCFYLRIYIIGSRCVHHDPSDTYIKQTSYYIIYTMMISV